MKLKLPKNCIDVTEQYRGTVTTLMCMRAGADVRKIVSIGRGDTATSSAPGNDATSDHEGDEKP